MTARRAHPAERECRRRNQALGLGRRYSFWPRMRRCLAAICFGRSRRPKARWMSPVVIVEFAPMPVAPSSQQDIAPGPEMVEAQPTPKPPPQVEPEVVEPTPKMEAPAPAEVTLPEPKPKAVEKKPEESPDTQKTERRAGAAAEHAGAAHDRGAALRAEHRGDAARAKSRQSAEAAPPSRVGAISCSRVCSRTSATRRGGGPARAGRGDAELHRRPQRPCAGAQRIARSSGVAALDDGGAGDDPARAAAAGFPAGDGAAGRST